VLDNHPVIGDARTVTRPPALDRLVARYLPPATPECPVFTEDSEWTPFVDGISYFAELDGLLGRVGPGDAVLVAGLQVAPDLDLHGRDEDDEGYRPVADLLAEKAHDGADVRVLLSGGVFSGGVTWLPVGPFRANVEAARRMRGWVPSTRDTGRPPLRDRVLLDWSGALIGSNHQKIVLVRLGDEVTAYVGGLDLALDRFDAGPHDRMRLGSARWGWHDAAVRLRGPAAERVWEVYRYRWGVAAALPRRYWMLSMGGMGVLNPPLRPLTLPAAPPQPARSGVDAAGTAVSVVRSFNPWAVDSVRLLRRVRRPGVPAGGVHEVFHTLAAAIDGSQRYVYVEDQYLKEMPGGGWRHTLYGPLRRAARRGVRVVLVGSGKRDPADGGRAELPLELTRDLRWRVVDRVPVEDRRNVVMYRVRDLTVHTKVVLVDDAFSCIGSANFFGRSMVGTDTELSSALVTTGTAVRDLRVALWAEHLRTPVTDELRPHLEDLDTALGIWRRSWLPAGSDPDTWRRPGSPPGFAPAERVLDPVRYSRRT
jgi:phosphatidylserine/phosphatidylglycerophosphate/cardiolipin synthase-like enzyme